MRVRLASLGVVAVAGLLAAAPAAGAATVDAALSHEVGTPSAPAPIGAVIGVRPEAAAATSAGSQPLGLEFSPEIVLGRGSDAPACPADALMASASNCPEPPLGGGTLELAAPGPVNVQLSAYGAPGGLGLNVLATSQAPAPERSVIPVTVGPDRSHLAFDWRELIARTSEAAGGPAGVTNLDFRLFSRGAWITTIGCGGSWLVRATLAVDAGQTEVPCSPGSGGSGDLCGAPREGVRCILGNGRRLDQQPREGKVSAKGWPAFTGILAFADNRGRTVDGTDLSDELLGGHGDDVLAGGASADVLWGDYHKRGNTPRQRDRLTGGDGDDFLYASRGTNMLDGGDGRDTLWAYFVHGFNRISAGAGNDVIWEHSGRGTIDCGPGRDVVHTRLGKPYALRGCERVKHYCTFGFDGHGGCRTPGGRSRGRR